MSRVSGTALVWKPLGKTPLETVEAFRRGAVRRFGVRLSPKALLEKVLGSASVYGRMVEASTRLFSRRLFVPNATVIPADTPIAYAGRLDPMAEGVLLLLIGDECKRIAQYRSLDKVYEVEVLLGASTDTGDLLGLVKDMVHPEQKASLKNVFTHSLRSRAPTPFFRELFARAYPVFFRKFIGTHQWEYPVFSSKTVQGKPLFRWFYEGRIGEIEIPTRQMTIYNVQFIDSRTISATELLHKIETRIAKVTKVDDASKEWGNDFRREEVLARWRGALQRYEKGEMSSEKVREFTVVKIRVTCSSGTYMRTLAEKIGQEVGAPALAFSITRTKIGTYYPYVGIVSA